MTALRLFTSESVTEGHPDKVADSVSDHVLDALLREDHRSRVAVETLVAQPMAARATQISEKIVERIVVTMRFEPHACAREPRRRALRVELERCFDQYPGPFLQISLVGDGRHFANPTGAGEQETNRPS